MWDMFFVVVNVVFVKEIGGGVSVKDVIVDFSKEDVERSDEMEVCVFCFWFCYW